MAEFVNRGTFVEVKRTPEEREAKYRDKVDKLEARVASLEVIVRYLLSELDKEEGNA